MIVLCPTLLLWSSLSSCVQRSNLGFLGLLAVRLSSCLPALAVRTPRGWDHLAISCPSSSAQGFCPVSSPDMWTWTGKEVSHKLVATWVNLQLQRIFQVFSQVFPSLSRTDSSASYFWSSIVDRLSWRSYTDDLGVRLRTGDHLFTGWHKRKKGWNRCLLCKVHVAKALPHGLHFLRYAAGIVRTIAPNQHVLSQIWQY